MGHIEEQTTSPLILDCFRFFFCRGYNPAASLPLLHTHANVCCRHRAIIRPPTTPARTTFNGGCLATRCPPCPPTLVSLSRLDGCILAVAMQGVSDKLRRVNGLGDLTPKRHHPRSRGTGTKYTYIDTLKIVGLLRLAEYLLPFTSTLHCSATQVV